MFSAGPRAQDSAGAGEPSGRIVGKVLAANRKTPVEGATVLAYHLSSEQIFRSSPTTSKARYEIPGLPYGYFDIAVETPEGLFVGEQVVNLAPAAKTDVTVALTRTEELAVSARSALRPYPGSEAQPVGLARLDQEPIKKEFWQSPKGIAVMAGVGGVILLAIASGSDNETTSSVIIP